MKTNIFIIKIECLLRLILKCTWCFKFFFVAILLLISCYPTFAIGGKQYIKTGVKVGDFVIYSNEVAADIYVGKSKHEYKGVVRATQDLKEDIKRVTGVHPRLQNFTNSLSKHTIFIGTIGKSLLIDGLIDAGKVDVSGIKGKWESFVIQVVNNPIPGVEKGLVIVGSDKRGTIFGIYDVSEQIGVSPWHYWADVPYKKKTTLAVAPGTYKQGPPSIKYRGIFLNDEFNLVNWAHNTFGEKEYMGPEVHKKIYELLLRLKANYLWPGMHRSTTDFNTYPENPRLADEYGIVMGSSHMEPMMRSVIREVNGEMGVDFYDAEVRGPFDYTLNKEGVYKYFDENAQKLGVYENSWTLGIRGLIDGPMNNAANENPVDLLTRIIEDQRGIIKNRVNSDFSEVLQVFCPYKEVLNYYNEGLKIPDDVCLLWPDDNHGYLRQVLTPKEQKRSGGAGVYYHISVINKKGSFLWLDSTTPSLIWHEMIKAYQRKMTRMWVVNVGDIKPAEINMEFFLNLAWDADRWNESNIIDFFRQFSAREFNPKHKDEIADILIQYYQLAESCRPEFSQGSLFSHTLYGDEAQKRIHSFQRLVDRAQKIYDVIPSNEKDAFYQLVLYKIKAASFYTQAMIYEDRSHIYKMQGRGQSVNDMAESARKAFNAVKVETEYYNKELSNGKWNLIMNPWYEYNWFREGSKVMTQIPKIAETVDPSTLISNGEPKLKVIGENDGQLSFSGYTRNRRFVDIINTGGGTLNWNAITNLDWICLSQTEGRTKSDNRIWISIDWKKAPQGIYQETINIVDDSNQFDLHISVSNPESPLREDVNGYMESHGYIAIEAEHYSKKQANSGSEWKTVDWLGRNNHSVSLQPSSAGSIVQDIANKSPYLEYRIYFEKAGKRSVDIYRIPTWNLNIGTRFAIALNDNTPVIVGNPKGEPPASSAKTRIEIVKTNVEVPSSGYHTLKIFMVDPSVAIDRIIVGEYKESYFGPPESFNSISWEE